VPKKEAPLKIKKEVNSKMDIIKSIEHEQLKNKIPELKVGNTVKVHVRIKEGNKERIQVFEGIIIKVQGGGVNQTFTVRKTSYGVGVEKTFLVHSPLVEKVELVRVGKARRARLFYLRDRVGKAAKTKEMVGARIENREITIKEETPAGGSAGGETKAVAKAVTIAIPPAADPGDTGGSKAPKVDIQLENSTVTLAANGETATFAEVIAATADNTLVVENGVTITKLTIKKGNIRLKGNAAITELAKDKSLSGTTVQIIVEGDGYTLPSGGVPEGFELVNGVAVDLNKVATEGGEYTLPANVTGNFVISAEKPVVINLNGHKITNKSSDTFTVKFGSSLTINGTGTVDNVSPGKACIYNNGTVVLNGGDYTRSKEAGVSTSVSGGNSYYNILNHGALTINAGVKVISTGAYSSLIASGYYSYKPKASSQPDARSNYIEGTNHANPSLTINGGTFSGGINTIKNDDGAELTIVNGTFTNMTQAAVQNNHIATISGGTFTPTGNASHVVESRYSDATYDLGQTTISGGTFNGMLYLSGASPSLTISGGTFSDPHALDYLTAGAKVNVNLLADTKLEKSVVMTKGTATFRNIH
jgi:ribosomal protein L19